MDGYYVDGLKVLECRPDGVWNGPDPVCSKLVLLTEVACAHLCGIQFGVSLQS